MENQSRALEIGLPTTGGLLLLADDFGNPKIPRKVKVLRQSEIYIFLNTWILSAVDGRLPLCDDARHGPLGVPSAGGTTRQKAAGPKATRATLLEE